MIEACGLTDLGFHGSKFTWCNHRAAEARVWKRLNRAMVNDSWLDTMPLSTVTHLPSVGSDHSPLLMELTSRNVIPVKYFKFLSCWIENTTFLDTVKACWIDLLLVIQCECSIRN